MRRGGRTVAALALLSLGTAAVPSTGRAPDPVVYEVDPGHSAVQFKVRHMGIATVTGRFARFEATFAYDSGDPAASWVTATLDAASIDTDHERRDTHLRSEDFLWVERHPTITFASRSVEPGEEGRLRILGDLTIRGVSRPVELDAILEGSTLGRGGRRLVAWSAETRIDRKEYGLVWNRLTEAGGFLVGDEVRILLEIEARGPDPAAAGS